MKDQSSLYMPILSSYTSTTLEYTKIPDFNGNSTPIHPKVFLNKVNQYFSMHPVPDLIKITSVRKKFVDKALLWYNTLISPPLNYSEFMSLF